MTLIIEQIMVSQSTIVKSDIEMFNAKTYAKVRKQKWNEHRNASKSSHYVPLPSGGISINQLYCKYFSERYAEFVCSDPIQDVLDFDLWSGTSKRYPFHSSYLPLGISITEKSDAMASTTALENLGAIVLGYLIECSNPPHRPIARPVQKAPDLISLSTDGLFFFHEAKATAKDNRDNIPTLVEEGITELLAGVCDVYRIVSTLITKFSPLTVKVFVTEMREKTGRTRDFLTILNSLETTLETEGAMAKISTSKLLDKIFGQDLSARIKETHPHKIRMIDEKIREMSRKIDENKNDQPIFISQTDLSCNSIEGPLNLPRIDMYEAI